MSEQPGKSRRGNLKTAGFAPPRRDPAGPHAPSRPGPWAQATGEKTRGPNRGPPQEYRQAAGAGRGF